MVQIALYGRVVLDGGEAERPPAQHKGSCHEAEVRADVGRRDWSLSLGTAANAWAQGATLEVSPSISDAGTGRDGHRLRLQPQHGEHRRRRASGCRRATASRWRTRPSRRRASISATYPLPPELAPGQYLVIGTQTTTRGRHTFGHARTRRSCGSSPQQAPRAAAGASPGRCPAATWRDRRQRSSRLLALTAGIAVFGAPAADRSATRRIRPALLEVSRDDEAHRSASPRSRPPSCRSALVADRRRPRSASGRTTSSTPIRAPSAPATRSASRSTRANPQHVVADQRQLPRPALRGERQLGRRRHLERRGAAACRPSRRSDSRRLQRLPSTSPSSSARAERLRDRHAPRRTTTSIPDASVIVYRSTDGGADWQTGVVAMEGGPGTNDTSSRRRGRTTSGRTSPSTRGGSRRRRSRLRRGTRDLHGGDVGTPATRRQPRAPRRATSSRWRRPATAERRSGAPANASPVGVDVRRSGSGRRQLRRLGQRRLAHERRDGVSAGRALESTTVQTWSAPVEHRQGQEHRPLRRQRHASHRQPPGQHGDSSTRRIPRMAADPTRPGWIYLVYIAGAVRTDRPGGWLPGNRSLHQLRRRGLVPALDGHRRDVVDAEADQRPDAAPGRPDRADAPSEHLGVAQRPRQHRLARPPPLVSGTGRAQLRALAHLL